MASVFVQGHLRPLHPLHAIFLAFPFPLFLGALLSDLAYRSTFQVQWINFSSWLIAGGLLVGAFALLWAVIGMFRGRVAVQRRRVAYVVTLLLTCVLGLINAFVHAKDAWATMPESLYLSTIATLLALVAAWIGFSGLHAEELK